MAPIPQFGTRTDLGQEDIPRDERTPKEKCEAKGGFWDEERQVCLLVKKPDKPAEPTPGTGGGGTKVFTDVKTGVPGGVEIDGRRFLGLSKSEVELLLERQKQQEATLTSQTLAGQEQQALQEQQQREGKVLAGQIGQFEQLPVSPTGLDVKEALISGARDAIPRAITLAGGAAVAGATVGLATGGVASVPLAIGAAAVTFVGSLAASMISNFKSQRTDTTTAQQRVLDEGKQTMQDWVTLAAADPANKARYLGEYNNQAALISQAYREMETDVIQDRIKLETAIPNLAEFETFYSDGGEGEVLDLDMELALTGGLAPELVDYRMIQLTNRRQENE